MSRNDLFPSRYLGPTPPPLYLLFKKALLLVPILGKPTPLHGFLLHLLASFHTTVLLYAFVRS